MTPWSPGPAPVAPVHAWRDAAGCSAPGNGDPAAALLVVAAGAGYHPGPRVTADPRRRDALLAQWDALLGGDGGQPAVVNLQVRL